MMSDNNHPKPIFKAELVDNKVVVECFSKHVPTLSYILQILQADITKLIIHSKAKEEAKNAPIIKAPDSGFKNFLRRTRR